MKYSCEELTPSPTLDYDCIPEHIKKKAMEISNYFQEQGSKKWKLMGIQSRDFSDEQYNNPVVKGSTLHLHSKRTDGTICEMTLPVEPARKYCWYNTIEEAQTAIKDKN